MNRDKPFDRKLRRLRRDRAASRFAGANYLHRFAAEEILDRLDLVKRDFSRALDLGSADGFLADRLGARRIEVLRADPGSQFAEGGSVQCDEDHFPFSENCFDLIVSIGLLDSVNDLPGALLMVRRALRVDGLFLGAFAGAGSLPRLKSAMLAAQAEENIASPHIHPQIDVRAAGDLLLRAGFTLPVADSAGLDVRFPDLSSLVSDLRSMGATNILTSRGRPLSRSAYASAQRAFSGQADEDGKIAERFELIFLTGWAPTGENSDE